MSDHADGFAQILAEIAGLRGELTGVRTELADRMDRLQDALDRDPRPRRHDHLSR